MEVKKTRKIKIFLKAVVVIAVVLALVLPSSALITNTNSKVEKDPFFIGKTKREIKEVKTWDPTNYPLSLTTGANIQISGWTEGDDIRPGITKDDAGNVFITYQHDEDLLTSSAGFSYNSDPSDEQAWFDNGVILSLQGIEQIYYPDTARCEHPDYPLMNVFVAIDTEEIGGMYIPDITDYETWEPYTWQDGAPEPEIAQISDGGWYPDLNYEDIIGPFNFYIYHEIYQVYDIPSCPIFFHTGIDAGSGGGYFDAQSNEKTAPASDPDYVNLPDRIHTCIYNTDTEKVIWKKIVPAEECDYEYTPYQETIADGTNPSIAAYETNVVVVYAHEGNIKCVYSNDDGDTWSSPVTIGPGGYPDCYAQGSTVIAAYVNDGNLYAVSSKDGGATWSTPEKKNDQDGTVVAQENCIDVHSAGLVWVDDRNDAYNIYYTPLVSAPNTPVITGSSNGKPNKEYEFTVTTTDPEGGQVWYWIDWGDTTNTSWLGPYASGTGATVKHKWTTKEVFTIKAKAKNADGIESNWANFRFSTPKITPKYRSLFFDFLARFPMLQYILGF